MRVKKIAGRLVISLYSLFFISKQVTAQNTPLANVTISSPTAASLGKYADVPVEKHTGIPDITIPIYTIKEGSLQLPIDLSYHASGLKVMENASWVGAGWALNAGGVITRSVQGAPDDRGLNAAATDYSHFWNYGYNNYLFELNGASCGNGPFQCPVGAPRNADDIAIANGHKDGEPDLYFFNFAGYTGKFYFRDDRQPVLVPAQDLKITPIFTESTTTVSYLGMEGFIVTTPDGTQYTFGKNPDTDGNINAIEITSSINTHTTTITNQGAISSWYLNKIVSADQEFSISLIYESDKSSYYTLSMFPVWNINNDRYFLNYYGDYEYDLAKNFVNGVRLSRIVFSNGTVLFTPGAIRNDVGDYNSMVLADVANTQSRSLGSITVSDSKGFCKKDSLYYSYFEDNTNPLQGFYVQSFPAFSNIQSDRYRLKLDAIQETTCDGTSTLPPHKFTYFPETVARKLSFGQDHWGFSNGVTNNTTLIPTYTITSSNYVTEFPGAQRDPVWPAMRGGTLQKITYPTGGSTSFEFEANATFCNYNTYVSTSTSSMSVGYDGSSNPITTQMTFSGNSYSLTLTNTPGSASPATARFSIDDFNNNTVFNETADAGITKNVSFVITPGTYYVRLQKNNAETGKGAVATLNEMVPTAASGNKMVGGLRIKTVTTNDNISPSNNIVTSYNYNIAANPNGRSSGILYSRPVYVSLLRNDVLKNVGPTSAAGYFSANGCSSCGSSLPYYKSGAAIMPMGTTQGNHIGYNEVTVSQINNGYSIYRYYGSNIWDNVISDVAVRSLNTSICDANIPNFPSAPLPFEYMRGELKYEGVFNQDGHPVKENFYFPSFSNDPMTTPGYKVVLLGGPSNWLWGTEYEMQTQHKTQDKIIEYSTDPLTNNYVSNARTINYGSSFHTQPTRTATYTSAGDSLIINNKYAFDFRIPACDNISNGYQEWIDAYNGVLSSYGINNNCTTGSSVSCHYLAYQQYRWDKCVARKNFINWRKSNFYSPNNNFEANHLTAKTAADADLKPILELQDKFYNPMIETSSWKNDKLLQASFTRYDYGSNTNKLYPEKTKMINLSAPSLTFNNAVISSNTISKDSRYQDEYSYKFSFGNAAQVVKRGGIINSYLWGYKNNLPIAQVKNGLQTDVAFTSFETDAPGTWDISSTARDPNSITGKSSYDLINGAVSKTLPTNNKDYIIEYWSKSATPYNINGATIQSTKTSKPYNGWINYIHKVTSTSTTISISGSELIDELRLYPTTAQMTSYTYDPLKGMTSQTDVNNFISYYEYDGFNRLKNIRDRERNIVKRYDYAYADQNVFTVSALNAVVDGFRQIEPGRMNSFFNPSGIARDQSIKDTRLMYRNGVAQLPEEYRTRPADFYSSLNLNLADPYYVQPNDRPKFCFMQDGYAVEWRVKMPANSYNKDIVYVGINFGFGVQFRIVNNGLNDGTYLYGYSDFDGRSYGDANGGGDFNSILVDNKDAFNNFQKIKLQVTSTKYRVYYNDVLIKEYPRTNTTIDNQFYVDAGFLGNDGSVDYIKVYDNQGVVKYQEDFSDPAKPVKPIPSLLCPAPANCQTAFTNYFNQTMGTIYTYSQIAAIYLDKTGQTLTVCN